MRRLSASEVQPGMILARALTDAFNNLVLKEQQTLTEEVINKLPIYGVDDLFIEDDSVADISVEPLVAPDVEAQITQALQTLYNECAGTGMLDESMLELVVRPIHEIAGEFFPVGLSELNTAPCNSPSDHLFRLPARASGLAMLLASQLGLNEDQTADVGVATALMNIGFLSLWKDILYATSPLTPAQQHEMKKHPVHGYVLLKDMKRLPPWVALAVLQSHELLNGSGYPRGISGSDIKQMERIVTIADTYFTLISPFNHGDRHSRHDAVEYIMGYAGELFDAQIATLFARKVAVYPSGVQLGISTGETGIVSEPNPGHPGKPKLRIIKDKDGFDVKPDEQVDMDLSDPRNRQRVIVEYNAA